MTHDSRAWDIVTCSLCGDAHCAYQSGCGCAKAIADALLAVEQETIERCAALVEQVARGDDVSEAGERAADAFNSGAPRRSMSERLRDWNSEIAKAIRSTARLPSLSQGR